MKTLRPVVTSVMLVLVLSPVVGKVAARIRAYFDGTAPPAKESP